MLKETITYTDYNGIERTEEFLFNLSEAELAEMEVSATGGYVEYVQRVVKAEDGKTLWGILKEFVLKSYGVKSPDGRRFMKTDEIRASFEETEAFSKLLMSMLKDSNKAAAFFNGVIPAHLAKKNN